MKKYNKFKELALTALLNKQIVVRNQDSDANEAKVSKK